MWLPERECFSLDYADNEEGSSVDGDNVREIIEEKEVEGVVTSLSGIYGRVDNDIVFITTVCSGLNALAIGDRVRARVCRGRTSEFWRAMTVSRCTCLWEDYDLDLNSADADEINEIKIKREQRRAEMQYIEKLLKDKFGVEIDGENFGCIQTSSKKSIKLVLRNQGLQSQTLVKYYMVGTSQQMQLGPLKIDSVSLKEQSKRIQETLPVILDPGMAVVLIVLCHAKYVGKESQMVVFDFEKFKIGRELLVNVDHPSLTSESKEQFFHKKLNVIERIQRSRQDIKSRDMVIVPGPNLGFKREKKYYKAKLHHYAVPEVLKDCIIEGKDLLKVVPCLKKPLDESNYEVRFKTLLHVEEVQQEFEMREFDIMEAQMEVNGEFLTLKVPGLLDGRPSLIQRDKVIVSKIENLDFSGKVSYTGSVHEILNDVISLKFSPDFHVNFDPANKYSVTFMINRNTLRRCHRAIELVSKFRRGLLFPTKINLKSPQVELIKPDCKTKIMPESHARHYVHGTSSQVVKYFNSNLNERQKIAVTRILQGEARPLPYVIFGPPGTGKTITVVEAILQLLLHLPKVCILACTPSNSAADLLTERLYESGQVSKLELVRLCAAMRSEEAIPQNVKPFCAHVDDKDLDLISKSVVVCTCSTAGSLYKGSDGEQIVSFSHVFVDEAGQAIEPECMIAVAMATSASAQIILAGDPQQLGPVLRSSIVKEYGLDVSYLERLCMFPLYQKNVEKFYEFGGYNPHLITKLVDNYRCHSALIGLSSYMFYDNELNVKGDLDLLNCLSSWEELPNKCNFPLLFHGVRGEDVREESSPSWFNPHEVILAIKYLKSLLMNDKYAISPEDIGIITPYRKQVEKIRSMSEKFELPKVKVGSVEEFQGQERLAIIISTVRSSESLMDQDLKYTLGFLGNPKRFNVSITRAHSLLVVIGNPHILCQDIYWSSLIKYCVDNGAYIGCDLPIFMDENFFQECHRLSSDPLSENYQPEEQMHELNSVNREKNTSHLELQESQGIDPNESNLSHLVGASLTSESCASIPADALKTNEKEDSEVLQAQKTTVPSSNTFFTTNDIISKANAASENITFHLTAISEGSVASEEFPIKDSEEVDLNHELMMKITRQIEYYFGEVNLRKDAFLQQKISETSGGWMDISLLLTFNKMKALNVSTWIVAHALRCHSSIVQVSEDGVKVRRDPKKSMEMDLEKWKEDLYPRSVLLKNYPNSELLEKMQNFFSFYGPIIHIERNVLVRVWANTNFYNLHKCDLILFNDHHSARNLAKHRFTRLQKMGLELYFMDDLVKQCLNFFVQRKFKNISQPDLPCIRGAKENRRGRDGSRRMGIHPPRNFSKADFTQRTYFHHDSNSRNDFCDSTDDNASRDFLVTENIKDNSDDNDDVLVVSNSEEAQDDSDY